MLSPRLFDIHCDTPFELYHQKQKLKDNSLAISLKKTEIFSQYFQVAAIWTDNALSPDDAYADFFNEGTNSGSGITSSSHTAKGSHTRIVPTGN